MSSIENLDITVSETFTQFAVEVVQYSFGFLAVGKILRLKGFGYLGLATGTILGVDKAQKYWHKSILDREKIQFIEMMIMLQKLENKH
ncbi:hypothetical protein SteCoe_14552 [Stentor coeruleus]|uniref:Uncharacterized protein n=1 Tax=Stentor coeruleus TaxID=5963 RepID=A0A1R2C5S4_9CILI|nr:hypothetical protein SteCoe_14552 [Stentor coeruleus]